MSETPGTADIVICGAGIAGISAAYSLAVEARAGSVLLVDSNPPLSLTSDHSTECYRNWWPDAPMTALMNRSIDRLEALAQRSGNVFHLNRRGYLYCSANPQRVRTMEQEARAISGSGAGALRIHTGAGGAKYIPHSAEGYEGQPVGADLLLDPDLIRGNFPYLSPDVLGALHVRRAGWFSAQQLGMYLLEEARRCGVHLVNGRVSALEHRGGRVSAVQLADGTRIATNVFINAAGPFLKPVGALLETDLPVYNELHLKMAFKDVHGALSRDAPLVILSDSQRLGWTPEERECLAEDFPGNPLLDELPAGLHTRPDGGADSPIVLALWEYAGRRIEPVWPIPEDPMTADVLLRGLPRLIPAMAAYVHKAGRPRIDGGYYTRTVENRPLIGKLPVEGAYVIGALSGFGLMAACGAGELLAAWVTGAELPGYAAAFSLERYSNAEYRARLEGWGASGQL